MKTKLLVFFGLVSLAVGLFSILPATPAFADLKCGDPGFNGPCQNPFNPRTADCSKVSDEQGNKEQCAALKSCTDPTALQPHTLPECQSAWQDCVGSYGSAQVNYAYCQDKVGAGKFAEATQAKDPDAGKPGDTTTCAVDGIGWIICPVVTVGAKVVDAAYYGVSKMLTVPAIDTSTSSPTFKAWSIMRNFANVAFVIAFLIVIYSQITGAGVGNYGIKKLLPRIIVAAILVNISYWLCVIAVDVSNILGTSLKGLIEGTTPQLFDDKTLPDQNQTGLWGSIAATVLVGGALLYVGLSALLPLLAVAFLAIVTVILVLTLRQALIIILIVISPLAFVAYLLPNTSSWFDKWRGLFTTLLLMFPIIAIIFGGSTLASAIITTTAKDQGNNILLQIMAAGIQIVPLLITPIVMKTAGGVLNRFGGIVNNKNRGPFDRMRKGAQGYRENRQQLRDARALNGGPRFGKSIVQRSARRQAVLSQRERNYSNAKSGYIADASLSSDVGLGQQALSAASKGRFGGNTKGDQLLDEMAKGGGSGARSGALSQALTIQQKLEAEEVSAAQATIKALNLNQDERRALAGGGSIVKNGTALDASSNVALQRAGMQSVIDSADIKGMNDLVDNSQSWTGESGDKLRQSLADSLATSGNKPGYIGQGKLEEIRQGTNTQSTEEIVEAAIRNNTYSPAKIAAADKDELNVVANVAATSTTLSTSDKQKLVDSAHNALSDPELARTITKNLENVQHVRTNTAPPPLS